MVEKYSPLVLIEGPLTRESVLTAAERNKLPSNHEAAYTIARLVLTNEINSIDALTGYWRRDTFLPLVARKAAENEGTAVTLSLIDMVGLGAINDLGGGQLAGNIALKRMAKMLSQSLGQDEDVSFGRLGGDEFGIVHVSQIPNAADEIGPGLIRRISETHHLYPDVPPLRIWYTTVMPGAREKDFMRAADPKREGLVPFVSYTDRLVRERISSKEYNHRLPITQSPLL